MNGMTVTTSAWKRWARRGHDNVPQVSDENGTVIHGNGSVKSIVELRGPTITQGLALMVHDLHYHSSVE